MNGLKQLNIGNKIAIAALVAAIIFNVLQLWSIKTSLQQSQESLSILANKEGVYLKPAIGIDARMYKNSQLGSPKIFIFNNGKVEAVNVVIQIIRRQFDGKSFTGATWGSGDGGQYVFDEIKTYEMKEITLPSDYIVDPEFNTIEIRIHYMREYDKQTYSFRTFYFYGPEGWNFKSWHNIKQAKLLEDTPFSSVIEESLKLPVDLDGDLKNLTGSELYGF
ncbi:MAG: hypothetical protein NUV64_02495 [Parcubacteria group bacterium]|nr:hypothetical protein [Parcubacteria group bacterium]